MIFTYRTEYREHFALVLKSLLNESIFLNYFEENNIKGMKSNLNSKISTVVLCGVLGRNYPILGLSVLLKQVSEGKLTSGIPALSVVHLYGGGKELCFPWVSGNQLYNSFSAPVLHNASLY